MPRVTLESSARCAGVPADRWTGAQLVVGLVAAADWLRANAERLNALNVYPVPDGDTGINMSLTLDAAVEAVHDRDGDIAEIAAAAAHAAVMGSRGNSGVILSQVLTGFARGIEPAAEIGRREMESGLVQAARLAYSSVVAPVEGTMLTAVREAAEAVAATEPGTSPLDVLRVALQAAESAVVKSPKLLPSLGEAGVVDAGAEGFRLLLEALLATAEGRELDVASIPAPSEGVLARARSTHGSDQLGYCTEFLILDADPGSDRAREAFETLGSSLIVVADQHSIRVHLHTERPGAALEAAMRFGSLDRIKIDNMERQHIARVSAEARPGAAIGSVTVVAVASGAGYQALYRELGALVVEGGETMNPSVEQVAAALDAAPPGPIALLPNNRNVVPVALQAARVSGRDVAIVDTISVAQGVGVLLAVSEVESSDETLVRMTEVAAHIVTVEILRATRSARVEGIEVRQGDYLALRNGKGVAVAKSALDAALAGLAASDADRFELLTAYRGADGDPQMTDSLRHAVAQRYPALAFEALEGGQPHHVLALTLE